MSIILRFTLVVSCIVAPFMTDAPADETKTVVVRLSRGSFAATEYDTIKARLDASQEALAPGLKKLPGLLRFWAGIDRVSNTMINVSVWSSMADAKQIDAFAPMLELAKEFISLGVKFERPVVSYEVLWEL